MEGQGVSDKLPANSFPTPHLMQQGCDIHFPVPAPPGHFYIPTLQEQKIYEAYLGQMIYFGVGEDE